MDFIELNGDQRREAVNTQQRYQAWREAFERVQSSRGSMVWTDVKGRDYLVRSYYDKEGSRRQKSLGPRSDGTEKIKVDFERSREEAVARANALRPVLSRQSAVNRALGLGRVPLIGARIIRAVDANGLLGSGIRVLGTNSIYAYEAAAGVWLNSELTTTEDVDLLLDSRGGLAFVASEDIADPSLLRILQRVDKSFMRSNQDFRAVNRDGYLVDLIKPLRDPAWKAERAKVGEDPADLNAVEIKGLAWHESAASFESVAIDERGEPLRIVTTDPRVWAAHKFWLSKRSDREAIKRKRDGAQARAVAGLVARYMPHLPFEADQLRMLPKSLVEEARPLFKDSATDEFTL
jgi:hypothetical protein